MAEDYFEPMSKVEQIKAEIDQLSFREKCELNALLHTWPDDEWDKQMMADSEAGGKLDKLKHAAEDDAQAGRLQDFPVPAAE